MKYLKIFKGKSGHQKGNWYYQIRGRNGEIMITSEGYTSKRDSKRGFQDLLDVILGINGK